MFEACQFDICIGDSAFSGCDFKLTVHSGFSAKPVSFHDLVKTFTLPDFFSGRVIENTNYVSFQVYVPSIDVTVSINDNNLRSKLSCLYFDEKTFPRVKPKAVEENFGILDKYFSINSSNQKRFEKRLEEILDE